MEIVLIVIGVILIIGGIIGCLLPIIPGPPLSYVGLLLLHFTEKAQFTNNQLIIWAIIAIGVTVIDNFFPVWTTKKFGGSKAGTWGSTIGLIVGMFFAPIGIILGPFLGAVVGELLNNNKDKALKAGFGAFMGFLMGVGVKMATAGYFAWVFFKALI